MLDEILCFRVVLGVLFVVQQWQGVEEQGCGVDGGQYDEVVVVCDVVLVQVGVFDGEVVFQGYGEEYEYCGQVEEGYGEGEVGVCVVFGCQCYQSLVLCV